ncbi:DNA-binding response regulator [Paenibacillus psychroresistens]|uniref:DNA-binding response regulator n=1 Tax=Paenibacillus psychroresistens TaxID=1778678 RepID=A0A6B8RLM9_9BACL|nr:response regulator [Paenibacillus psychroresistens]QGQ97210.1 DNA-binding response regulator [Paenibacillus psychroresistens]
MMKLLLVDDEEHTRMGIRKVIDWQSHGIEICAEARDGIEAIELIEKHKPEILLTDIRMPEMDGLELIEQVSLLFPTIKCIIMSGYEDFSYAQKALKLGVTDYLLKPCKKQEIMETVLKVKILIEAERLQEKSYEQLRSQFQESYPVLKERHLTKLVQSDNHSHLRTYEILSKLNIHFPYDYTSIMLLSIDNFYRLNEDYSSEDMELYKFCIKNISEETISAQHNCVVFEYNNEIVVILNKDTSLEVSSSSPLVESLKENINRFLPFTVSIGLSNCYKGLNQITQSYTEASKALKANHFMGENKIVAYAELSDDDPKDTSYPINMEKSILQALLNGDISEYEYLLNNFINSLKPESSSKDHFIVSTSAFIFSLYHLCVERNINTQNVFGPNFLEFSNMLSQSSMDHIKDNIYKTLIKINEELNSKKNNNKLFKTIIDYIDQNYDKDIDRETVAREVFITPGYLSLLFKQELKINFLDYLHKTRIEKSCLLLSNSGSKISDIAYSVGYNDEKYFFQVFKKYTGMTPNQYRNSLL